MITSIILSHDPIPEGPKPQTNVKKTQHNKVNISIYGPELEILDCG